MAIENNLKYLRRTKDVFLIYGDGDSDLHVKGHSDASFQSDRDDSKSQSSYVFTLKSGAIIWKGSKKEMTTDSTTYLEYIVASDGSLGSNLDKEVHL